MRKCKDLITLALSSHLINVNYNDHYGQFRKEMEDFKTLDLGHGKSMIVIGCLLRKRECFYCFFERLEGIKYSSIDTQCLEPEILSMMYYHLLSLLLIQLLSIYLSLFSVCYLLFYHARIHFYPVTVPFTHWRIDKYQRKYHRDKKGETLKWYLAILYQITNI